MKLIVDTHIFLWVTISPKKISKRVKDLLLDPQLSKYVSAITFWEISLKYQLGKIDLKGVLPDQLPVIAKDSGFEVLGLDPDTAASFYKLPRLRNKDPFDRMLAWQAVSRDFHLLTKDQDFADYKDHGLKIVW